MKEKATLAKRFYNAIDEFGNLAAGVHISPWCSLTADNIEALENAINFALKNPNEPTWKVWASQGDPEEFTIDHEAAFGQLNPQQVYLFESIRILVSKFAPYFVTPEIDLDTPDVLSVTNGGDENPDTPEVELPEGTKGTGPWDNDDGGTDEPPIEEDVVDDEGSDNVNEEATDESVDS